jgi:hypothetical protein
MEAVIFIGALIILLVGFSWGISHERCQSLTRRCFTLEEQLLDAQTRLTDEQRVMERKLTLVLNRNIEHGARGALNGAAQNGKTRQSLNDARTVGETS